jgi:hypothetical protein
VSVPHQRLTIFEEDDTTPLAGLSPLCSTDPTFVRPYMQRILEMSESEVDFIEGSSTIGVVNAVVLDKRTVANDQQTGWFTALLSNGSVTQISGYRILIEQQASDGSWFTLMNGVVADITLNDTLVEYTLEVKDMRERERKVPLFNQTHGEISLIPMCLNVPYGVIVGTDGSVRTLVGSVESGLPPYVVKKYGAKAIGVKAKFSKDFLEPRAGTAIIQDWKGHKMPDYDTEQMILDVSNTQPTADAAGNFGGAYHYPWVAVRWRPWIDDNWTDDDWTVLSDMPYYNATIMHSYPSAYVPIKAAPVIFIASDKSPQIVMNSANEADLPEADQDIEVQLLYYGPPTEELPLLWEGGFGQLLKDIYDGVYSEEDPKVRYNATRMAELQDEMPWGARLFITAPEEDIFQWVQDNIYKPLGYAPVLDENGEIYPVKYAIPGAEVELVQLDNTNIKEKSATWRHSYSDIVNKVVFTYHRDLATPVAKDNPPNTNFIQRVITTKEIQVVEVNAPSAGLVGPKAVQYEPVTVRSISMSADNTPITGDSRDELGHIIARARVKELFDRFSYGGQRVGLTAMRVDPAVSGLRVGDWVTIASTYLPDYISQKRGMDRIGQIIKIQDISPIERKLEILDAGPTGQPLALPTLGTLAELGGRIEVPILTVPAGADVRVDYVISDTLIPTSSGLWNFAGRHTGAGAIFTPHLPVGVTVWIRARSEQIGRRPSAWTTPISFFTVLSPVIRGAYLIIEDAAGKYLPQSIFAPTLPGDEVFGGGPTGGGNGTFGENSGQPIVKWEPDSDQYGYRIWWQTWEDGEMPGDFEEFEDVNASVGEFIIPKDRCLLHQRENILVAMDPSSVWPIP